MKILVAKLTILVLALGLTAGCAHYKGSHGKSGSGCGCSAESKDKAMACGHKKADGDSDKECKDCKK